MSDQSLLRQNSETVFDTARPLSTDNTEDFMIRQQVARQLLTMFGNRPDLIERALNPSGSDNPLPSPLIISIAMGEEGNVGGLAAWNNRIFLDNPNFQMGLQSRSDGYEVLNHEFVHILDFSDGADGLLPGMTPEEQAQFIRARNNLYSQYYQQYYQQFPNSVQDLQPGIRDMDLSVQNWQPAGPVSQLSGYSFSHIIEFLPEAAVAFVETPQALYNNSPELYGFFRDYFQMDPLAALAATSNQGRVGSGGNSAGTLGGSTSKGSTPGDAGTGAGTGGQPGRPATGQ